MPNWGSRTRSGCGEPWKVVGGEWGLNWVSGHLPTLAGGLQVSEQVQGADGGRAEGPRAAGPAAGRRSHPGQAAAGGQQAGLQSGRQVRAPSLFLPHPTLLLGVWSRGPVRWALQMPRMGVLAGPTSCPFSAALLQPRPSSDWGGGTALPDSGHTHGPSAFSDPGTELSLARKTSEPQNK